MTGKHDDFRNLDPAGRATGALAQQPRMAVYLVVGMGIVLSWSILGAMAIRGAMSRPTGSGAPGDRLIESFPQMPLPEIAERFFALCLTPAPLAASGPGSFWRAVRDVVPDGRCHDASIRGAIGANLLRDRRYRPKKRRARGSSAGSCGRLPVGLVGGIARVRGSDDIASGVRGRRPARSGGGHCGRCSACGCRPLPVQRAEGSLPEEMPQPFLDPVCAVERAASSDFPARCGAGASGASAVAGR